MADKAWSQLSPDEKLERRFAAFVRAGARVREPRGRGRVPRAGHSPEEGHPPRGRARPGARVRAHRLLSRHPQGAHALRRHPGLRQGRCRPGCECNLDLQADTLMAPMFAAIPGRAFERSTSRSSAGPATVWPRRPASSTTRKSGCRPTSTTCSSTTPPTSCCTTTCRAWPVACDGFAKLASPLDMVEIVDGAALDDALGRPRRAGQPGEAGGRRPGMRGLGRDHLSAARPAGGRRLPGSVRADVAGAVRLSSATRSAAPAASSWTCSASPTRCSKPATGWRRWWSSGSPGGPTRSRRPWCSSRSTRAPTAS